MTQTRFKQLKKEVLPTVPHNPGIYRYYDKNDTILYVGKAKDLRRRVSSYFTKSHAYGKTKIMVAQIDRIEFTVVETEQDALLLENVMIKKLQPKYNVLLKDDKSYPYICIKKERFPRVFLTRQVIKDGSEYLGPYTSVSRVRMILDLLASIFPLRNCTFNLSQQNIDSGKFKVCLQYHLGKCRGACEGKETEEEYQQTIDQIRKILKGNVASVIRYLKQKMGEYAENFEFENAQVIKEKLNVLQNYQSKSMVVNPKINNVDVFNIDEGKNRFYVSYLKVVNGTIIQTKVLEIAKKLDEPNTEILPLAMVELRQQFQSNSKEIIVPFEVDYQETGIQLKVAQIGDKKKLLDLAKKNAFYVRKQYEIKAANRKKPEERTFELLNRLKQDLRMEHLPKHIECFDNSHFQGSYLVSSMVIFRDAKPAKREYRHFKAKTVFKNDDFAAMKEVVFRRYRRLLEEGRSLPQLVIVDGGKGQLGMALQSLDELGLRGKIHIVGIAKKLEEIYRPGDPYPLHIDKRSPSLKLLQHLRNEAHRFAITFHRKLRSKGTLQSELEKINGIGTKTTEKLLKFFKSMKKIKAANEEALLQVVNKKQAKAILDYFQAQAKNSPN